MVTIAGAIPLLDGETLMSWVGRIARTATGLGPFEFLNFIELNRKDVLEATPVGLDRLTTLTGRPRAEIERGAYLRVDLRLYEHRGERFHAEFAGRTRTTYCPACLLEDGRSGNASGGLRVGRINWLFAPVRACRIHRIPLVRQECTSYAEQFQDMGLVAPGDALLQAMVAQSPTRDVSPLQTYVERRLDGAIGPAWLDGQAIDQAARACEMLGAIVRHGPKVELPGLSEDQWDAAGAEGFAFTARGAEGVREALDRILVRFRDETLKGGPQAAFGRLYQWLQFNRDGKDRGPIRGVLRDHILDSMAIEPGANLLGAVVETRRRHSVASLAKASGIHPKTLNRALVQSCLMPEGDPARVDGRLSVEAEAGERLAARLKRSIPVLRIPSYLNCNRTQAEMLVRHGFVGRILPGEPGSKTMLNMVALDDLDAFHARLVARACAVDQASAGMADIVETARISRWPVVDIVSLILDGGVSYVEALASEKGFRAIQLNPVEVGNILNARQARGRLSLHDAAARLGYPPTGIRALMTRPDRDGRPFLKGEISRNGHGAERHFFRREAVERFAAAHVEFAEIALERGFSQKALGKELRAAGVDPILPRAKLNKLVYRRADVLPAR
jgi:DNA-binding phage protein